MENKIKREIKVDRGEIKFYEDKDKRFSTVNVKTIKVSKGNKRTEIRYNTLISDIHIRKYQKRIEKNNVYKKQEKAKIAIETLFSTDQTIIPVNLFTVNSLLLANNEHIEAPTLRKIVKDRQLKGKMINGVKCYYPKNKQITPKI